MRTKVKWAVVVAVSALAAASSGGALPPRAPGTIAFSGDDQILIVRNGRTTQLTHDTPGIVGIAWAPNGSRLLAWRYRSIPAISVVNSDGSVGPRVASNVDRNREPRWSPDGKWIALQLYIPGKSESRGIYLVGSDGRNLHKIVTNAIPSTLGGGFDWSPDGKRLAYFGRVGGRTAIFVTQTSGPAPRDPIFVFKPSPVGYGSDPVWSPDGSTIAFHSGLGIVLIRPDGTALRELKFPRYVYGPAWSPDGSKLAVVGRATHYVINVDGTGLRRLPGRLCKQVADGFSQRLSWSPDGSMIAYSAGTGPASCTKLSGIYVEKLDGSAAVRVASSPMTQYSRPLWRPVKP